MSKENELTKSQRLRFPEFRNEPEWEERELSEVLTEHGLKSSGTEEVFSVSVHKGVVNQIEHLGRSFSAATTDHYKQVLPGDIIYTKSPTGEFPYGIIKQSKVTKPVIVSPLYGVFTPETKALGYILDSYFESRSNTFNYLSSIVQKGAKNTINILNETFLSKSLYLPKNKEEQQKIADCLLSLDESIIAQSLKLKTLNAYKKGLMQVLFPPDGETLPKLRFSEFKDSGEWQDKRLDAVCEINPTINKLPEHFVYIDLESVEDGVLIHKKFINREGAPSRAQRLLKKGDVIFQTVRPYQKNNYIFLNDDDYDYVASTGYAQLRAYQSEMYLYQYLHNPIFVEKVLAKCAGSNYPAINSNDLSKILVAIPEPAEQQKIAGVLSSTDLLITAQKEKIEAMRMHKKGLMQLMFPVKNKSIQTS